MNTIAACISSPPWENSEGSLAAKKFKDPEKFAEYQEQKRRSGEWGNYRSKENILRGIYKANNENYGSTPGNLGNMKAGDFEETNTMNTTPSITTDWTGLYKNGWQNEIVPEAFSHPAKFSRALIRHIYEHAISEGWLREGDCVVDPFGGVALGGLDAMRLGLNWTGVELEPRFVDLGNQNIAAWNKRYQGKLPRWGEARLLQGDSRELGNILNGIEEPKQGSLEFITKLWDGLVEWQPESKDHPGILVGKVGKNLVLVNNDETEEDDEDGIDAIISSPPYAGSMEWPGGIDPEKSPNQNGPHSQVNNSDTRYGSTPGQLGAMRAGSYDAAVSSPPYAGTPISGYDGSMGEQWRQTGQTPRQRSGGKLPNEQYGGATPGQLGTMESGDYDAAISSPPYENAHVTNISTGRIGDNPEKPYQQTNGDNYNQDNPANLGNSDTFWTSARQIVDQVYSVLRPGGAAIWVVKAYVKNKQIVPFPDQWRQMCEAAGFVTLHEHRAWLVEQRGTQIDLEGNHHTKTVERKSFFRRLAEAKGSPRIDFEVVLCMVKPGGTGGVAACISSPPFHDNNVNIGAVGDTPGLRQEIGGDKRNQSYGSTPGNLGNMKAGDFEEAKKP